MHFHATASGAQITCDITPDRDLATPVFCGSLMVPSKVARGGTKLLGLGGYFEVQLPNLTAGQTHRIILEHEVSSFHASNRAWLPLGPYLRTGADTFPLAPMPAGVSQTDDSLFAPFDGLRLVPQPTTWTPSGEVLTTKGFATPDELDTARALSTRIGLPLHHNDGAPLRLKQDQNLKKDAYSINITSTDVTLSHSSPTGALYGAISLMTLLHTHNGHIPCGVIHDSPRFDWRGQHLDCARHFYTVDTLLRLLDLLALLKLNRFHWHFADDEAFRLQIDCYPQLWQQTEFRGEGELIPGVFGGGIRSGGSYSKDDVARVVAHAATLGIEVLPEIEVPAHALAMCLVMPELRDQTENGSEESVQGYRHNVINPAKPQMWEVTTAIADEVATLFPFKHLHLGCDELPADTWLGSPAARALMQDQGLETTDDLQGWTMAKIAARLGTQGIRSAAWEEAAKGANGGIGNNAILFSWTGQGAGVDAARAGYDVVMSPAQNIYLDMAHSDDADDWGANWAAVVSLEDTIAWDPVPANAPDIAKHVIGIEGTFWSEFTTQDSQMEPMLAPRILGVAIKGWQEDGTLDGSQLRSLAGHYRTVFDTIGWDRYRGA